LSDGGGMGSKKHKKKHCRMTELNRTERKAISKKRDGKQGKESNRQSAIPLALCESTQAQAAKKAVIFSPSRSIQRLEQQKELAKCNAQRAQRFKKNEECMARMVESSVFAIRVFNFEK